MEKKKSLTAALSDPAPEPVAAHPAPAPAPASPARPDREGKTNITGYFDKPVKWELQDIANERSRRLGRKITLQDLLEEALNDLFKKEQRPELATVRKRKEA